MDDIDGVNPNDEDRITQPGRDAKWFLDTWRHYLKRKYKDAIHRWDKETGGGSHEPYQFANFCDKGNRWLVWVYLMDLDRNFLLYSNAIGRPPVHVGRESGFDNNTDQPLSGEDDDNGIGISDLSTSTEAPWSSGRKKRKAAVDDHNRELFIQKTAKLETILTDVSSVLKKVTQPSVVVGKDVVGGNMLQAIIDLGESKKKLEDASIDMDPTTRSVVLHGIMKEINKLGMDYRRHVFAADEEEDE